MMVIQRGATKLATNLEPRTGSLSVAATGNLLHENRDKANINANDPDRSNTVFHKNNPFQKEDPKEHYPSSSSTRKKSRRDYVQAARNIATLRNWRNGVTGRIQFALRVSVDNGGEGKGECEEIISEENQLGDVDFVVAAADMDAGSLDTHLETNDETLPVPPSCIHPAPPPPPPPPAPFPVANTNGIPSKSSNCAFDSENSILPELQNETSTIPSPPPPSSPVSKKKTSKRRKLFLEIEKCIDLKAPNGIHSRKRISPFVLIRLNGKELGRTPALKWTKNPIWYDECFEFPVCDKCSTLCLEAWEMVGSGERIGDFVGKITLDVPVLLKNSIQGDMAECDFELTRWKKADTPDSSMCLCPLQELPRIACPLGNDVDVAEGENHRQDYNTFNRRETVRVKPGGRFTSRKRRKSIQIEKPSFWTQAPAEFEKYKIPNPHPFRRRDIREVKEKDENDSFFKSTLFKALQLISAYLALGVVGYSYVFEKWLIRDSLYFSVVTFTTVGYGDIKPKSDGGKLFSCIFALLGIGIIGIALGYIGQNLVQAQVMALQRAQRKAVSEDYAQSSSLRSIVGASMRKRGISAPFVNNDTFRNMFFFVSPISIMILLGSAVVGRYEDWNWIDSIYWCVITGTSVGFGDFAPKTDEMRWFSVIFIPLSVGVISAALGRIANIFVEREIAKSNTKLLKREVTLEDLEVMNADGDGEVSLLEFVEYMLKSMHKVDQNLLDELHRQFERLDADGSGGLQQDDLELLTEWKLSERRTDALARYADNLLVKRPLPHNWAPARITPDA